MGAAASVAALPVAELLRTADGQEVLAATFHDFAFAPGDSEFDRRAAAYFKRRPNTCLVTTPWSVVSSFKDYLTNPTAFAGSQACARTEPRGLGQGTRYLYIVSHGNNTGEMKIPMDMG